MLKPQAIEVLRQLAEPRSCTEVAERLGQTPQRVYYHVRRLVDAQLVWSATPLTTVTFNSSTSFDETNIAGASGAISRAFKLDVSHALLRNLTLTGSLGLTNTDYTGIKLTENIYDLGFKADYNLSRSIVIRGSFTHERLKSTATGNDYTQNIFLLGLRLQR